ncbi:adenosine deaminase [Herbiconiux sp. P15]|uniref:adenosine deaminase family protein n=1 Tax=Herbiconiux liukaitaii TaxID=3342799 RepID=UPI0035B9A691
MDLAGNESGFPAAAFAPAFQLAREAGLRLTAHAGEAAGPESVWSVIDDLGVERVGHGLRAADDPRLMETLAARGITLDLALSSNVHTGAAASFERHPVRELLAAGVPVTLNTDDPRASNVTLSHEHDIAVSRVGLTPEQVALMAQHSENAAFRSRH